MKALVLAAGFGTRLLPVTRSVSKVSLPLAGIPVIGRVIQSLRRAGVESFLVNLHHAGDSVRAALAGCGEMPEYSAEETILGTAGALHRVAGKLRDETFLLVNGDCLYGDISLEPALRFHRDRGAPATLVLLDMPPGERYGAVELDSGGRIIRISGRPAGASPAAKSLHFCGIHIIEPELLDDIPPGFSDIIRDVYIPLLAGGVPLYGFHTAFAWQDIGTPERFLSAEFALLRKYASPPGWNLVGEGCVFDSGAEVGPLVELGPLVHLGARSRVARSLVCEAAEIGAGCRVEGSIVAPGVRLPAGTVLENSLAGMTVEGGVEIYRPE